MYFQQMLYLLGVKKYYGYGYGYGYVLFDLPRIPNTSTSHSVR